MRILHLTRDQAIIAEYQSTLYSIQVRYTDSRVHVVLSKLNTPSLQISASRSLSIDDMLKSQGIRLVQLVDYAGSLSDLITGDTPVWNSPRMTKAVE